MEWGKLFSYIFSGSSMAIFAAALAVTIPCMGSAKGVGSTAEAAAGLLAEAPETFGRVVILIALPGTQGIYGLLVSFLILFTNGNVLNGSLPIAQGIAYILAALPIAIVGYYSAIRQGRVATAGLSIVAKKPEESMKGVISAGLVETYAVLALLISVLAVFSIPRLV
jgi:V/A-type H+-transporting ATPase subunit K